MIGFEFLKAHACLIAWQEADGYGTNAMLGVLFALRNRVKNEDGAGWQEILQKYQHVRLGFRNYTIPDTREPGFQTVLQHSDGIIALNAMDNLTEGAKYFGAMNDPEIGSGGWFEQQILGFPEEHPRVAQVGQFTFFK